MERDDPANYNPSIIQYYNGTYGLEGDLLRNALNQIISYQNSLDYHELWDAMRITERDPGNHSNVSLIFSLDSINGSFTCGDGNPCFPETWTRHHLWPRSQWSWPNSNSYVSSAERSAGTDLHAIRASYKANDRGSDGVDFGFSGADAYEPVDFVKGDIARSIFYMELRYIGEGHEPMLNLSNDSYDHQLGNTGYHKNKCDLYHWTIIDPVDSFERDRNDLVHSLQGNRNPFIDIQELAKELWSSDCGDNDHDSDGWTTLEEEHCGSDPTSNYSVPLTVDSNGACLAMNPVYLFSGEEELNAGQTSDLTYIFDSLSTNHSIVESVSDFDYHNESSPINASNTSDAPGWSTSSEGGCVWDTCNFTLGSIENTSGPPNASSFPNVYGIGFSGNYQNGIDEARLISPSYDIPQNGTSYLTFDHWSCSEAGWDGGAVFIKVNNGAWQYFDPGWYSGTAYAFAGHNLQGMGIFTKDHCTGTASSGTWASTSQMTNLRANLDAYKGDSVQFKFAFGSDSIYSLAGWFIDNAGVGNVEYNGSGSWTSPVIDLSDFDNTYLGSIMVNGQHPPGTILNGSILDPSTNQTIGNLSEVDFPISLEDLNGTGISQIRVRIAMDSNDTGLSPLVSSISMVGTREVLSFNHGLAIHLDHGFSNGCPYGTYVTNSTCSLAGPGEYTVNYNSTSPELCPYGTYNPEYGLASALDCSVTSSGNFSTSGSATQTACLPGSYQPSFGQEYCLSADPGHYVDSVGSVEQTECPPGSWSSGYGSIQCTETGMGHYTPFNGSVQQIPCSVGSWNNLTGQTECFDASPGHYVPSNGSTIQYPCQNGTYQPQGGQSYCVESSPGHYVNISAAIQQNACLPGTFQPSYGQFHCIQAAPGYYVPDSGADNQTAASIGYFTTGNQSVGQTACPWNYTTVQLASSHCEEDTDGDGAPDYLDEDDDGDQVTDVNDFCPRGDVNWTSGATLGTDHDGDGCRDSGEDIDDDGDGVNDTEDSCPVGQTGWSSNAANDIDGDGCHDLEDFDDDNDGVTDEFDSFPTDFNESGDNDGDGIGDNSDDDDDNDNVTDDLDAFPLSPSEWSDTDSDGIGDNADMDDDGDGVPDSTDDFPYDSEEDSDFDADGIGDNADTDDDGDGIEDVVDVFPLNGEEWLDTDSDGIGDNADPDDDNDQLSDGLEIERGTDSKMWDTDGDGYGDFSDMFPNDPLKWSNDHTDDIDDDAGDGSTTPEPEDDQGLPGFGYLAAVVSLLIAGVSRRNRLTK